MARKYLFDSVQVYVASTPRIILREATRWFAGEAGEFSGDMAWSRRHQFCKSAMTAV